MSEKIAVYIDGENISYNKYDLIHKFLNQNYINKKIKINVFDKKKSKCWDKIIREYELNFIQCNNIQKKDYVDNIIKLYIKNEYYLKYNIETFIIISCDKGYKDLRNTILNKKIIFLGLNKKKIVIYNYEKEELKKEIKNELKEKLKNELKNELKDQLKSQLKKEIKNELKDQLKSQLKSQLKKELKKEIKNELKDQLKSQLKKELKKEIKNELKDQLKSQLKKKLKKEIKNELKDQLKSQLKSQLKKEVKKEIKIALKK